MDDDLTLHQVAAELGVHYMTAYRYVRLGMLPARREGRQWRVRREDLEHLGSSPVRAVASGPAPWADRLYDRMIAGDEPGAWWVIESALSAGSDPERVVGDLLPEVLARVGAMWKEGAVGIEQEHAASRVATRLLGRFGARFAHRGATRGLVAIGGTESELHDLPLSLAAQMLRLAGYDALDLGGRLPPDAFAAAAGRAERLVAVGVGVTTTGLEAEVRATVAALRAAVSVPIIVGGAGVPSSEAAEALGCDGWASSGRDLVSLVERLAG